MRGREIGREFAIEGAQRGVNVDLEGFEAAFVGLQHLSPFLPSVLIEVIVLRFERGEASAGRQQVGIGIDFFAEVASQEPGNGLIENFAGKVPKGDVNPRCKP